MFKRNKITVQGFKLSCGDRILFKNKWYVFLKEGHKDENKSPIWEIQEGRILELTKDGKYIGIRHTRPLKDVYTDYYDTSEEAGEIKILSIL